MIQASADAPVTRFSWPMRVFLFLILFHMFFRSTDILYPWTDWAIELGVDRSPPPLPTPKQLAELREQADGGYEPVLTELTKCLATLPRYWCPVPTEESDGKLNEPTDWIKYAVVWPLSRLEWCESVLGTSQEWPMFSPNVSRFNYMARARLFYADGSEITVRQRHDLEDFTSYLRWDKGKNICFGLCVNHDSSTRRESCAGWCNYLAHRHAANEHGTPLTEIRLYDVKYFFPPPDVVDARAFLLDQQEKTRDHHTNSDLVYSTYYIYWPPTREWQFTR